MATAITTSKSNAGFSLIELMIGMLLGILLMAGAASIYLGSKRSFTEVEQVATLSDNGRFALKLMTDSLRHIGFSGQVFGNTITSDPSLTAIPNDCTGLAGAYNLNTLMFAVNSAGGGNVFGCITDAKANTDVLVVKHVVAFPLNDANPDDPNAPRDNVINFPDPIDPTKTYIMTNHAIGILFDGADTAPSIETGGAVPRGTAWEYLFEVFYIRDPGAGGAPQLARKFLDWDGMQMVINDEDLVPGAEDMRLQFGFDSNADGDVDSYSNVAGITDWSRVSSVEAFVLVRNAAQDLQYTDGKTYQLGNGVTITPDPNEVNYRRTVMHTRVSLRNMKLVIRGGV
ncbi:MAG: type IV pilus assembly protein PilW [Halioglobus sp.]|jgi:type IV pilus assembly protein PilW